jgi:P-type conjugative transfer protein VirB9
MMRIVCLLAAFVLAAPALAIDQPKQSKYDPRIQRVAYNELDVVAVNAGVGYATHIVFEEGEEVGPIASGFSNGWEFSDSRNNFYLKPKSVKDSEGKITQPRADLWNTNLVITTNRRHYSFMLKLHENPAPNVSFRVVFSYPQAEAEAARVKAGKQATQQKLAARAAPRNWHYTMHIGKDSQEIAPTMAYDDGRFTYVRFPGNREIPALFAVADNKAESMVNVHIDPKRPDVVVMQRVLKQFVLRSGEMVVGVYNENFDSVGLPPQDGTTVPGVKRVIKDMPAANDATYAPPATAPVPASPAPASTPAYSTVADDPRAPYLPANWNPNAPVAPAHPPLKGGYDDE